MGNQTSSIIIFKKAKTCFEKLEHALNSHAPNSNNLKIFAFLINKVFVLPKRA